MAEAALDGLRVLDLSAGVGGGYCAKLLACYGAGVIKVEAPGTCAPGRAAGPFRDGVPNAETSALQLYLDTGKESITLDLDMEDGRALLQRLAATADVLVEDAGPGVMEARGLGYDALAALNPEIVYVSVSPFGSVGPYAAYQATDLTLYALGGYMYLTGDPDREPLQGPGSQPAYLAGAYALTGVMAALWARADGVGGQRVEVTELEAVAASHQWTITRYNYSGMVQRRIGNRYDSGHPITIYPVKDGYVSMGISTDDQAERFFVLIGQPELIDDQRFNTNLMRLANADEFDRMVKPWLMARTAGEVVELCQEMRIPSSRASTPADLLTDPHLQERGFWRTLDHPRAGELRYPGPPYHLPASPGTLRRAPLLGEDNERVYGGLGLSPEDLTRLRETDAI